VVADVSDREEEMILCTNLYSNMEADDIMPANYDALWNY